MIRVGIDAHTVGRAATGNERFTVELASALAARHDIDVLAYVDRGVSWPDDAQPAPRLAELRLGRPQLRIPFELPARARRDRLDLLQVAYVAPPISPVPLVTVVHDLSFEDRPDLYPRRTRLRLQSTVRRAARRSAAVVTGSDFTRGRLIDAYDLSPERVHRVRYGVAQRWRPIASDEAAGVLSNLDLPGRFVLAVGTAAPRKNLGRLVEAVARLRTAESDLGLVLVGPAASGATEPWIRRLGYVSDDVLRALYSTANVVAYVSLYEGFGLPVLEALACGATVVASDTTAVLEAAGDACVLVEPGSAESIGEGLSRALGDSTLREDLRGRAAGHLARFSWAECAEGMVEVYRVALRRPTGAVAP